MTRGRKHIDIIDRSELSRIAAEVRVAQGIRLRDGKAVITPLAGEYNRESGGALVELRQRNVYRLSELDQVLRELRTPRSAQERESRRELIEKIKRQRDEMPIVPGDIKDWIREERREKAGN